LGKLTANMKSDKVNILIASGLILCSIISYMVVRFTHLRIKETETNILVLVMFSVWGLTYFYITLKFIFKDNNDIKVNLFRLSFFTSLFLFIMTLPIINYCDGWQTRQEMGRSTSEYLQLIGSISFLYFLFLGILYSVNVALTLAKYFKKKNSIKNVILSLVIPLSGLIAVITFLYVVDVIFGLNENERCDFITGPSDTGLSYILFISIIMNLIQYKISADNSMYEK
jgi:hypothetical protein